MPSYTHFTIEERKILEAETRKGTSIRAMARILGRAPSSVSREIRRNYSKGKNRYNAWRAQTLTITRRRQPRRYGIKPGSQAWRYVEEKLRSYWSPETICGRWEMEHPGEKPLSAATIYRYVKQGLFSGIRAKTHLRRRGKKRYQRSSNYNSIQPDRIIPQWPDEIKARSRIGDWEGDTVYGAVGKGALVTLVDRKSRFLVAGVIPCREADVTRMAAEALLEGLPVKSISFDNGSEFAEFRLLEQNLSAPVYFAEPHKPWQRGTNENTNGILRFFFPKGFDFLSLSPHLLRTVVALINSRPRKCLGWRSPAEVFASSATVAIT